MFSKSKSHYTLNFSLKDKFGDYGLISIIILKKQENNSFFIDTWIMSCRVLKRGVEKFVLNCIIELAKKLKINQIIGEYLPTNKNNLVKDHYKNLGFVHQKKYWILNKKNYKFYHHFIKRK